MKPSRVVAVPLKWFEQLEDILQADERFMLHDPEMPITIVLDTPEKRLVFVPKAAE